MCIYFNRKERIIIVELLNCFKSTKIYTFINSLNQILININIHVSIYDNKEKIYCKCQKCLESANTDIYILEVSNNNYTQNEFLCFDCLVKRLTKEV